MMKFDETLEQASTAWLAIMSDYKDEFGCIPLPTAPMLTERHLEHCRLLPNREALLRRLRVGAIAAEVGVQTGNFSQTILNLCQPAKLHLIDLDLQRFAIGQRFHQEIAAGQIALHEGDSASLLASFPEHYFDFVYIDADHSYQGVVRDISAVKSKLKPNGMLIFNDYTYWSPVECMAYGVIQAVNELCLAEDWEIVYFALGHHMYCDVALRRC